MKKLMWLLCCFVAIMGCDPAEGESDVAEETAGSVGKADQACNTSDAVTGDVSAEVDADAADAVIVTDEIDAMDSTSPEEDSDDPSGDAANESEGINEESLDELLPETTGDEETTEELCDSGTDPFAQAYDVNLHKITFPEGTPAPTYKSASTDTSLYLGGTEFWQKWPGGENPTYSYYAGTQFGQRCMYASARRFEAIMAVVPEALVELKANSGWGGSFFNWNDDFSESTWGDGSSARLWAWRTTLVKWISQTNRDGSCYLPTLSMVQTLADKCAARAATSDGEIQGCTN